jgi:xanthine dehydrogenase accessory factor
MNGLAEALIEAHEDGAETVLATVIEAGEGSGIQAGEKYLIRDGRIGIGAVRHEGLRQAILREAAARLKEERPKTVTLEVPGVEGGAKVFFEIFLPPPKLYVVGAGHIAVPLVRMAKVLDFVVTVIDDRILYANRERFPDADEILVGDMAAALKSLPVTSSTYIVLITRGHKYDEPCLREIVYSSAKYIGMIGSKRRVKACFQRFRDEEKIAEEVLRRVHAPIGLDINAETPEEIALCILAEMVKVRRGGRAQSLSGH